MAKQLTAGHWGPVALSAAVLAIASLGDSLLYVVLPISAAEFGVNLVWVGMRQFTAVAHLNMLCAAGFLAGGWLMME